MLTHAFEKSHLLIFGHRGSPLRFPENSLLSFKEAMNAGADGIECDVRLSRDYQVFVFHDEKVLRLTHQKGSFKDYFARDIKKLDLGYPFGISRKIQIPTLEELLTSLGKRSLFYIELKGNFSLETQMHLLAQKTMNVLKKLELIDRSILVSFDYKVIRWIKKKNPKYMTGLNFSKLEELNASRKDHFHYLDCLCPQFSLLNPSLMKEAKDHSLDVMTWVVNTKKDLCKAIRLGVKGVVTDDPKRVVRGKKKLGLGLK
ncbi:MAG: glycerophosphodiester phosphodiesterase [Chlamydiae bacterium]|nr:glycerophosphodiester phosphodiesterase [Chlamydiota bacterium]MBI3277050.1 glycerophosphodiester phosphodiesterase [Chlamydiota bacterium]